MNYATNRRDFFLMKKLVVTPLIALSLALFMSILGGMAFANSTVHASAADPATASTATVGGCSEHYGGPNNSFDMGICISNRGSWDTVYPDVYVNQQPTGPFLCTLYIEV